MPYQCENDGQPAVMAISNLDTGAVVSPCQDCLLPALLGMVLALTPEGYSAELLTEAAAVARAICTGVGCVIAIALPTLFLSIAGCGQLRSRKVRGAIWHRDLECR